MAKISYTAIVFFPDGSNVRKYRKIQNLNSFKAFCLKIGASYVNLYDSKTKEFIYRLVI